MSTIKKDGATSAPLNQAYFTEKEVAERLRVSVKWLQKRRLEGGGIPFCKFGSAVRYAAGDLLQFEQGAVRASTSDTGGR